jgi:hypothetical protein
LRARAAALFCAASLMAEFAAAAASARPKKTVAPARIGDVRYNEISSAKNKPPAAPKSFELVFMVIKTV